MMRTVANSSGPQLNDLLNKLGVSQDFAGDQARMLSKSSVSLLKNLRTEYAQATRVGPGAQRFLSMMKSEDRRLPPFGWNRPPSKMLPITAPLAGAGYSGFESVDRVAGTESTVVKRLFNPRRRTGARLERLLRTNPHARGAFESAIGGNVVSFGRRDGRMMVQRFSANTPTGAPSGVPSNLPATNALSVFGQMEAAIMAQARRVAAVQQQQNSGHGGPVSAYHAYGGAFPGLVMSGLSAVYSAGMSGAYGNALGGAGVGSWNPNASPGRIQNTNPLYERAHQAEVDGVLNDPALTVEDKVTLMIMLIMNKQDDDIQRQGQYINSIQQQQSNRQGKAALPAKTGSLAGGALGGPATAVFGMTGGLGGAGGKLGGEPNNSPSIDVESLKLKRMIDKRTQMFDMLRSIIDKYNETAKNIIQSIGR